MQFFLDWDLGLVVFGADWAPLKDIIIVTPNTEVPSRKPTLLQWKSGLIRGMASLEMDKGQETWKRWIRQEIYLNETKTFKNMTE